MSEPVVIPPPFANLIVWLVLQEIRLLTTRNVLKEYIRMLVRMSRIGLVTALVATRSFWRRVPWKTIWVANAGSEDDIKAYVPRWFVPLLRPLMPLPMGFFYSPGIGWSLILATSDSNEALRGDPDEVGRLIERVARFRARRISLNGVLPAILFENDAWPDDPRFVREAHGALHMLEENLAEIGERHPEVFAGGRRVGVIGTGHTGAQLSNHLTRQGYEVLAWDPRPQAREKLEPGVRFVGRDPEPLRELRVVVFLSSRGDDAAKAVAEQLRPGAIILSDTHPKISRSWCEQLRRRGLIVYESALTRPGTFFFPKMPRWERDTLPGCMGQAMVEAVGDAPPMDLHAFKQRARELLTARLDRPGA